MNQEIEQSEIAKMVWSKLNYTPCIIDGKETTIIEIKDVWGLIKEIEKIQFQMESALDYNIKVNIGLMKKSHSLHKKKFEILNEVFKSKDGLSWNELTESLNELIELTSKRNFKEFSGIFVDEESVIPNPKGESFYLTIDLNSVCAWNHGDNNTTTVDLQGGLRYRLDVDYPEFCNIMKGCAE